MSKDAYYFKHDAHARHDPKIRALINKYGLDGYGKFWVIIEMLREETTYKLQDEPYIWEALAEQMKCTVLDAHQFINDCAKDFKLLIWEDGFFYSAALLERMVKLDDIRQKRVRAGKDSWNNR